MKIWCVEDDGGIRDIEVYTLCSTGFEARGFPDGEAFFDALRKDVPDLVILDVMLPGEDGNRLLARLKQDSRTRGLPVIMVTARGEGMDKVQGLDGGADLLRRDLRFVESDRQPVGCEIHRCVGDSGQFPHGLFDAHGAGRAAHFQYRVIFANGFLHNLNFD